MKQRLCSDMSSPVRITVGPVITVTHLSRAARAELIALSTFDNPEFYKKQRMDLWTGDTDPHIHCYASTGADELTFPRGSLSLILDVCKRHDLHGTLQDTTVRPKYDFPSPLGQLYDYQERAALQLLLQSTGILEAPTGSGKTNILLSIIPMLQTPTLILVHTLELLKQTRDRSKKWLGIDAGIIGSGKWTIAPITVAMMQTLAKQDSLSSIRDSFGAILVDEAHHVPCKSVMSILGQLNAKFKYGFTATPFRKDKLDFMIFRAIGPITAKVSVKEVHAAGKTIPPDIVPVFTNFQYDLEHPADYGLMINNLIHDDARNCQIIEELHLRLTKDTRCLILSDRIDHVNSLAVAAGNFFDVAVLTGELSAKNREDAMAKVRNGARLTIATTSLLSEGIDVPGWDLLFLASPIAGGPRTLQAVGRVTRAAPGKDRATVIDFVDIHVPMLAGAYYQRKKMYKRTA